MANDIRIELPAYSMFSSTAAYQLAIDGVNVALFGLRQSPVVPDLTDIQFTVPVGGTGRLDKIAQKFYDTPELAWAIADCNPGMDPMVDPHVGEVISVPTRQRLATLGILTTNV
jgi:hypothetical protein